MPSAQSLLTTIEPSVPVEVAAENHVSVFNAPSEALPATEGIVTATSSFAEDPASSAQDSVVPSTDLSIPAPQLLSNNAQQPPSTNASPNDPTSLPATAVAETGMASNNAQAETTENVTTSSPPTTQLESANLESQQVSPTNHPAPGDVDQEMTDSAMPAKVAREREDDDDDSVEPSAKRTKTDTTEASPSESTPQVPAPATTSDPSTSTATNGFQQPEAPSTGDSGSLTGDFGPMTDLRQKRLLEGMRNFKKSKNASAFTKPVDHVAMNLPRYPEVIKSPMDLSTMEQKLKDGGYTSVNEYVADFNTMVQNSITFNGQSHPVSQSGMILRAQLVAQLKKLPRVSESAPPPAPKKAKRDSLPDLTREPKRRDSQRHSLGAAQTPGTPHATGPDGVPIIRRESAVGDRPKRKLVKPAPKELAYAKPQKKKYRAELKFAEDVLVEMKRPRYHGFSFAFLNPVDPVVLSIPDYHKIIKYPMDVSTITEKLSQNQYENLKEFENDFRLIFKNCYKFNPTGTGVNAMGKQYEDLFNTEMAKKNERIAAYAPPSTAASPAADSDESEEEEDEDEIEEEDRQAKIKDLTAQLAEFTQKIQSLSAGPPKGAKAGKKSKTKAGKGGNHKSSKRSSGVAPVASKKEKKEKPKSKPKPKLKQLTNAQKEEIATRIGELPTEEIAKVAEKIKSSLRMMGKPVPPDDELEFQIDDIPEDLLNELYLKVRRLGSVAKSSEQPEYEDDEYDSPPPVKSRDNAKPKKNKPMSKDQQENQISRLQNQLATFQGQPAGDTMFPSKSTPLHLNCNEADHLQT